MNGLNKRESKLFKVNLFKLVFELKDATHNDEREHNSIESRIEDYVNQFLDSGDAMLKQTTELEAGDDCPSCQDGTLAEESRDIDRLVYEYLVCENCLYEQEI